MAGRRSRSYVVGVILVTIGGMMLLGQLGFSVGWIIPFAIAGFMIVKGWQLYRRSESGVKQALGVVLLVLGLLWMVGLLPVVISLAAAGFLMYFGWKMIKEKKLVPSVNSETFVETYGEPFTTEAVDSNRAFDHLDEWEREMKNRKRDYL